MPLQRTVSTVDRHEIGRQTNSQPETQHADPFPAKQQMNALTHAATIRPLVQRTVTQDRKSLTMLRIIGLAGICLGLMPALGWSQTSSEKLPKTHSLPETFTPVDTSQLMHAPDPLPLENVPAFPQLKFKRPVELTHANDETNRLFVVEQQGTIRVFENRDDVADSKLFLDLRDVVSREGNEEGLLGLAFHPNYRENGQFFVYYSTKPRASVVARFTVSTGNPNQADRNSERKLLEIPQPYSNHNGGSLRFGPDGYLYIGLGDGGKANDPHVNAQNLATLLGSILRIDVDHQDKGLAYAIPQDNPFANRADARGEIWAYGLRNVWRLAFDRKTGDLWAGDVGQNRFEEVNRIQRGGNYGWNIREGFHSFEPNTPSKERNLIDPLAEYFRGEGRSVTGGMVYRGERLKDYQGAYFYADYVSGNVWALRLDGNEVQDNRRVAETGLQIAAFGEDQNGEMYLCTFGGAIQKLQPRDQEIYAAAKKFPRRLSETGLFASVKNNVPAKGLIPYELNMPFWSDFAVKDRYIALPDKGKVVFHGHNQWEFPVGTVFVKTFWMHQNRVDLKDPVRLETRLLVNSPSGWKGYTYVYRDDQTDAELLDGSLLKPIEVATEDGNISQPYYFPSRTDCMACHTKAAGFVLGLNTRQMNHTLNYHQQSQNQIELLDELQIFTEPIAAGSEKWEQFPNWGFGNFDRSHEPDHQESVLEIPDADTAKLARAWLDVNCANCHRPEGIAAGSRDLRSQTALGKMKLVEKKPLHGHFTPPSGTVLTPGKPLESELFLRAAHRGVRQMPPLASNIADPRGMEVLRQWIAELNAEKKK